MNYLALFCLDLQTLLKPIIALTRKGIPFHWGKEQEEAFQEVKHRISRPPVLHLPRAIGRLVLFSDTSKVGTSTSLWQYQDGKPHLIGYASKTLPDVCLHYSVTELEMTGLLVNMGLWKNILKHREFDAAVDHVAVTQILKAKTEPASNRIMRLLDCLSAYSFNLYYLKGKDMILADYLSRNHNEDEDPADLIPVSFCKIRDIEDFCVATRASVKASGETVPEVHGVDKELDPHITPEQQYVSKVVTATPKGTRPKILKTPVRDSPHKIGSETKSGPVKTPQLPDKAEIGSKSPKQLKMLYSSPRVSLLQPRSFRVGTQQKGDSNGESIEKEIDESDVDLKFTRRKYNLGIDTGEGEEILDPEIKIPEESEFYEPEPLEQVIDVKKQGYNFLPKQGDVDKILTQRHKTALDAERLKGTYLTSPHFEDVYLHLLQNRAPINKSAAHRLEVSAHNYMLLDGLLFKITENNVGEMDTVLCIPTSKVHVLLEMYHSSVMGGHVGITKCYLTISQRFYCPNLAEQLRAYIAVCQLFKKGKKFDRPLKKRVNINVPAMTKISMDIKHMPASHGYSYILVLLCEVSNYMVALPSHSTRTPHILQVFQKGYVAYFRHPTHIVCDQDGSFTSSLMQAFTEQLNIKMIMVSTTNHKSLLAEHGIKILSNLLVKHLTEVWSWPDCLPYAMLCYNSYSTPNLDNMSPYELVFGHKATISHELEIRPDVVVSGTFTEYYEQLKKNLKYMRDRLQKFRSERTDLLNKNKEYHAYEVGQIV